MAGQGSNRWQSSWMDCFADCGICCKTLWCPCLTYQEIRDAMYGGHSPDGNLSALLYVLVCLLTGFEFIFGFLNRADMRKKYGLETQCFCCRGACAECCLHFCCHPCAMCQEAREMKNRPLTPWGPGAAGTDGSAGYTPPALQAPISYGAPVAQGAYPPAPVVASAPPNKL